MAPLVRLIGIAADVACSVCTVSCVGDKYARAVLDGAGGLPLLIPALAEELGLDDLLQRLDGLMFTGSASNVEPHHIRGRPAIRNLA